MFAFKVGDKVRSRVDAQGLVKGRVYEVVQTAVQHTPFGGFTEYKLVDGFFCGWVGNGHLVLERVKGFPLCSVCHVMAPCSRHGNEVE